MGPQEQPDYINAVCEIKTGLTPLDLLDKLQAIEATQGRVRTEERWGPRPLDLDILLYGGKSINTDRLIVPHPGMLERNFVLYPLHEIAPDLIIPGQGPLASMVKKIDKQGLTAVSQV
jgi:2-amino-4-hydroxy-6-hydroxymethyldihydropteridine diphosphokinase